MIEDYLQRLRVDREPLSFEALRRLVHAHVERVPYETVWLHTGERYTCSPQDSLARIARSTRGGYCYHLNGAFSELLAALGYHVVRHVGGVHGPAGPSADVMTNHLVLTVHDLPSDEHPKGDWYVDVGLGDALYDPLPLKAAVYEQRPFQLELTETPGGIGDWHLRHDPAGCFPGMAWRSAPTGIEVFEAMNTELSTSPDSGFVKTLSVQRRSVDAVDILRGLVLLRVGDEASERTLQSADEMDEALRDVFGLYLEDFREGSKQTLWQRTHDAHLAWEAGERP